MKYTFLILLFIFSFATTGWSQVANGLVTSDINNQNGFTTINKISAATNTAKATSDVSLQVQAYCYDSLNLVRISWNGPAGFKNYDVFRNEVLISTNIKSPFYVDSSVSPAAYYHYSITAKSEQEIFSSPISPDVFTSPCLAVTAAANPFQITVSPNPSPAIFYFTAANLRNKILSIEVLNYAGTRVYQQQTKSMAADFIQTIDLSSAPAGVYFMKVQIDRNIYFKQLVKQ